MARYPDILNNPDGDPRIYQQQYEDWWEEQEQYRKNDRCEEQYIDDLSLFDR